MWLVCPIQSTTNPVPDTVMMVMAPPGDGALDEASSSPFQSLIADQAPKKVSGGASMSVRLAGSNRRPPIRRRRINFAHVH